MNEKKNEALEELQRRSIEQIQFDTAMTWAYRAWAARKLAAMASTNGDRYNASRLSHDAVEYEHEAIEHAALCGVDDAIQAVRGIVCEP